MKITYHGISNEPKNIYLQTKKKDLTTKYKGQKIFLFLSILGLISSCTGNELSVENSKAWHKFFTHDIKILTTFDEIKSKMENLPLADKSPECYWIESKDSTGYKTKNKIDHPKKSESGFTRCTWIPNTTTFPPGGITIVFGQKSDKFIWAKKSITGPLLPENQGNPKIIIRKVFDNPEFK